MKALPNQPPPIPELPREKSLNVNETEYILDATLKAVHRNDPTVLKFISSYLVCRDIRQAAHVASIPYDAGRRIKNRADISKAIKKVTSASAVKFNLDPSEIVEKTKEIMDVDIGEFENEDGSYKTSLRELPPEIRRAVKKFEVKNLWETDPNGMKIQVGVLIKVDLHDKMKAVELLGREVNLFKETKRVEHDVTSDMKDLLLGSRDRAEKAAISAREKIVIDVTPSRESGNGKT